MAITFDPAKRNRTLVERGLDFLAAEAVVAGPIHVFEDLREDYGETRLITVGLLSGRMMIVGWTPRGADRHVLQTAMSSR
ncbi:BrnT family toxin [uncultured Methylobacterium sp.]|uniref:BrnT family toxin n=1 Tax=uncultured Methylobacterium sp. TaxID=157278 RepID=UPI0035C9B4EC